MYGIHLGDTLEEVKTCAQALCHFNNDPRIPWDNPDSLAGTKLYGPCSQGDNELTLTTIALSVTEWKTIEGFSIRTNISPEALLHKLKEIYGAPEGNPGHYYWRLKEHRYGITLSYDTGPELPADFSTTIFFSDFKPVPSKEYLDNKETAKQKGLQELEDAL